MTITVAIQMDAPETLSIETDTSILMATEAQRRGHKLFYYNVETLRMINGEIYADIREIKITYSQDNHDSSNWYSLGKTQKRTNLANIDVILMRQDPPFNMQYITATYLLEHLQKNNKTIVVNNPTSVRNAPEKIFPTIFTNFMPETAIAISPLYVEEFLAEHKDIVIKPLHGFGGKGIFHLKRGDDNVKSLVEMMREQGNEPIVMQKFLPEVTQDGDKRVIIIDGEVEGILGRIPESGEIRANLRVGAKGVITELTEKQKEICQKIGKILKEQEIIIAGIDLIGDYLIEVNITSPTGLCTIKKLYNTNPETKIWNAIERKLQEKQKIVIKA